MRVFLSGAGGLVSTVRNYPAFCRMLLNRGVCGTKRLLLEASIGLMTTSQITPQQREGAEIFFGHHRSWGFGMGVNILQNELWKVPGRFGWDGGFGTSGYSDPTNDFIGILLAQRMMDSPEQAPLPAEVGKQRGQSKKYAGLQGILLQQEELDIIIITDLPFAQEERHAP